MSPPKGTWFQINPGTDPAAILDASQVIWDQLGIHLAVPEYVSGEREVWMSSFRMPPCDPATVVKKPCPRIFLGTENLAGVFS